MRAELKCKIIKKFNIEEVEKNKKEVLKLSFIAAERNPRNKNSKPIYCVCYGNIAQEIEDDFIDGEVYFDLYGDVSVSQKETTVGTNVIVAAKDLFESFDLEIDESYCDASVEIPFDTIVNADRVLFYIREYDNAVVSNRQQLDDILCDEKDAFSQSEHKENVDISSMSSSVLDNF